MGIRQYHKLIIKCFKQHINAHPQNTCGCAVKRFIRHTVIIYPNTCHLSKHITLKCGTIGQTARNQDSKF